MARDIENNSMMCMCGGIEFMIDDKALTIEATELREEDPILFIWTGYGPYRGDKYVLFTNRIRIETGSLKKTVSETHFSKFDRLEIQQNFFEQLFNNGSVILYAKAGKSDPVLHVHDPEKVMADINQAMYNERKAYEASRRRSNNGYYHRERKKLPDDELYELSNS